MLQGMDFCVLCLLLPLLPQHGRACCCCGWSEPGETAQDTGLKPREGGAYFSRNDPGSEGDHVDHGGGRGEVLPQELDAGAHGHVHCQPGTNHQRDAPAQHAEPNEMPAMPGSPLPIREICSGLGSSASSSSIRHAPAACVMHRQWTGPGQASHAKGAELKCSQTADAAPLATGKVAHAHRDGDVGRQAAGPEVAHCRQRHAGKEEDARDEKAVAGQLRDACRGRLQLA